MSSDVLIARGLTIASPTQTLVRDVSLRLGRGQSLGIIGESGSGKTLTLRSLMGLLPPGLRLTAGHIDAELQAGTPRTVTNPYELCGHGLSMVFQDPLAALDPTMRVGAFVAEVLARLGAGSRRSARSTLTALFTEVGFRDPARIAASFPHQLSNGQRQRVVLALALASQPTILLCDEATSALDVTTQAQVIDLLNDLRVRRGLSIVFVTHDLAVARHIVHDVVVLFAGRVVEVGDIETVLTEPRHPYTRSLIRAYSTGRSDLGAETARPSQRTDPGCAYRRQCELATHRCETSPPTLDPVTVRIGSACLLDEQPLQRWSQT